MHMGIHSGCLDSKKILATIDAPPGVPGVSKDTNFKKPSKLKKQCQKRFTYASVEIELIEILIPVDSSLANLNVCNSKCAISSIKYIMRNPHITNISANGTLQDKIRKGIFERALSMTWFWKNKNPSYISFLLNKAAPSNSQ